jgi:tRNA threonylcarbamoyladenosine biosynthesis protein TsaE
MSADTLILDALDEAALVAAAQRLAPAIRTGGVVHLSGDLGAGKTTFARALLRALGVGERVKSPTYSLIESYRIDALDVHHLDLYRIADPGELEWLGLDELHGATTLMLVEWPERGAGALPPADLALALDHAPADRRRLEARAFGPRGAGLLRAWRRGLGAGSAGSRRPAPE